ncbi:MAG: M20/M25/M40 family metallo-hydrolase [Gemmatimonadales bacterium]
MRTATFCLTILVGIGLPVSGATGQTYPVADPVLQRIWGEGMENSQLYPLAQALLDSIGPRLTGTPGQKAANDWAVAMFDRWGIDARNEQYGTWKGWRRGISHIDLIQPRVRSLEGTMLAWSPGTPRGRPVEGAVVILPDLPDSTAYATWLPQVRDKFVAVSMPQPTCRADASWEEYGTEESFERMKNERTAARRRWQERLRRTGYSNRELPRALERAGALGILTSRWSGYWGATRIFQARTDSVPTFDLSCEDYGLVARLAEHDQNPVVRMQADAEFMGEVPIFNTIATIRGTEKPDEYILLSAHFDSWDGASGATDNGTGSLTMIEAARILSIAYPHPKRTILIGLWTSEEQGLNGSRAFARDHPEVIDGLQALFNQDNGTGRVQTISMQGLVGAGPFFAGWFAKIPSELTGDIGFQIPGNPSGGGSDHASFICSGAPAFGLFSRNWDYFQYTWHTNRDTFDKIVFDDLKQNATLFAMLAYLASEEPARIPRDRRVMPVSPRTGEQRSWPECRDGARSWR